MSDRFQHLFDSLSDQVVVFDRELGITYANPAWFRRVDLSPSQVLGKTCLEIQRQSASACLPEACAVENVFQSGKPCSGPCPAQEEPFRAPGPAATASPVFDADGNVTEVILIFPQAQDTKSEPSRKRLQTEATQIQLISGISQRILSILDPEELLGFAAQAIQKQFDYYYVDIYLVDGAGEYLEARATSRDEIVAPHRDQQVRFRIGQEGITGLVAATGTAYVADDVGTDPHYIPDPSLSEAKSELVVPIKVGSHVLGVLDLNSNESKAFDDDDLLIAQSLADLLAIGLENARLFASERQRLQELQSIQATAIALGTELQLDSLLGSIASEAMRAFQAEAVSVMKWDEAGTFLEVGASCGLSDEYVQRQRVPRERLLAATDTGTNSFQLYIPDLGEEPLGDRDLVIEEDIRSVLTVSLVVQGTLTGLLKIYSKGHLRTFTPAEVELAEAFAGQAAVMISNAQLYQQTEHYASEVASRAERLALMNRISMALSSTLDLDEVLNTAVRQMAQVFGVQQTGIILFDDQAAYGTVAAEFQEIPDHTAEKVRIPLTDNPSLEHVIATREPLALTNAKDDPLAASFRDVVELRNIQSILLVPLLTKGQVIGTIGLDAIDEPRVFTAEETSLAQTIASQIAIAIDNARLFTAEARRRQEAETLQSATQALSTTLDLQEIFEVILSELQQVVPYDSASVQQLQGSQMTIIGGHGFPNLEESVGIEFSLTATNNPNREVIRTRTPLILVDAPARYRAFRREPHAQADIRSWLGVPLLFGDQLIGMLALDKQEPGFYTEEHARLALAFAAQAAIAIENARLYEETQQRLGDLTRLFVTSAAFSTSLDVDRVLHIAAEQITQAMSAQGCAISIWHQDQQILETLLSHSTDEEWHPARLGGTKYALDEPPATRFVLSNRQPLALHVDGPDQTPLQVEWLRHKGLKALLMVPMIVRDKVLGLLELMEADREREFTPTEINMCQTLANQAAAALDNARLFQEAEARAREMGALAAVGQAMNTLDLEHVLDTIAEKALEAVQAEIGSVYLLDAELGELTARSVQGRHKEELARSPFKLGEGTIGMVAQSGQPLIVDSVATDDTFLAKSEAARWIHNTLTVPLRVKDEVIGTLEVCNKVGNNQFNEADERLLTAFAAQAAVAIDNTRLYGQVRLHLEEVLILNEVATAATATLDFDEVVRRSLAALLDARSFERINLLLVDEARGDLWLHPALAGSDLFPQRASFRIPLGSGVTGYVAQTGQTLRIDDTRQESRYLAGYPDSLSELCVPLHVGDRIIGVLDAQSTKLNAFTANDERLLTTLAGQISTVLDNTRLFVQTQRRVRDLTALAQVSLALNKAKDLATVLDIVLEQALTLLGSQEGSLILISPPGGDKLQIVAERGLGPEIVDAFNSRPVYTHEGTYRRALESEQIVEVAETDADPDFLHDVGSRARTITNVPLITDQGAIGLIACDGLPEDDSARQMLSTLAGMAAVAIDKERLHQETASRLSEVSTLFTLSNQITSSLALSPVLESIVTILKLTLDCRACAIFLIDATGDLQLEAASSQAQQWQGVARLRKGEGISGRVIEEQRAIYVPDTRLDKDFLYFGSDIRSLLVVPMIVRDKVVGTLSIDDTKPNAFHHEGRLLSIAAAQAAVAIENARLHESLQESYGELEQSYNELRQLDTMKSEFVQNISHELRTPLTFIKGYVELLLDGDLGSLGKEQIGALDVVSKKAETLSRLVDDIISLQQAERKRQEFAEFSLSDLGHEAMRSAQASALELDIHLYDEIPDADFPIRGDRQRMGQVFDNLLQNALKFSEVGGTITIRMSEVEGFIRTEVQDTGIGIPADQLPRIFDRFYQVDGTPTRRFGGTGLGLAIVKQILESHGGRVGVESIVSEGSTFYFLVPKASSQQKPGGQ